MTKRELMKAAKLRVRATARSVLDKDIEQLIEVALADMKRIGVKESYLDPDNITDPLVIEAALLYVAANFGNPDNGPALGEAYQRMLVKLKGGVYVRG